FGLARWNKAQMVENSRQSLRDSFPRIFGTNWERARDIFYDHFNRHHTQSLAKLEGAEELLDFLQHHGIRMAICSNKAGSCLRKEVRHLEWMDYFVAIVGAQDAEKDKPDAAPVKLILKSNALAEASANEVWFIGDMGSDMQCAWRSGVVPVGIGEGSRENPAFMPKLWAPDLPALLTGLREGLSSFTALPRDALRAS
ncbi:MAG TPA: HAD hydrolase-like protein, partial [Alphaproteobacteria bacterium]|nr:HAD hydrolase-like protein [Alphaproteobacteria bacterium]